MIEQDKQPVAILHALAPPTRTLEECLALLSDKASDAVIDEDFAQDVEAVVAVHRDAMDAQAWD